MVRNIDRKMTQDDLLRWLVDSNADTRPSQSSPLDFLYLPFDASKRQNFGYAFINAVDCETVKILFKSLHHSIMGHAGGPPVAVAYARLQGRAAFISQFKRDAVLRLPRHCRPLVVELSSTEKSLGKSVEKSVVEKERAPFFLGLPAAAVTAPSSQDTTPLEQTEKLAEAVAHWAVD